MLTKFSLAPMYIYYVVQNLIFLCSLAVIVFYVCQVMQLP